MAAFTRTDAEVELKVDRAEGQALHAGGAGQRAQTVEACGRFDQGDQRPTVQRAMHGFNVGDALGLGQHHAAHRMAAAAQCQVVGKPLRARRIDAHEQGQ